MLRAPLRAVAVLPTPPLRRVVLLSLTLAIATFALLWVGAAILLDHTALFGWAALNWLVDLLGTLAVLALSWLLFPAGGARVMGVFLYRLPPPVRPRD